MKRREFLKNSGSVVLGLGLVAGGLGSLRAFANTPETKNIKHFPPDELREALYEHFNKHFNGEYFDPEKFTRANNYTLRTVESFDIEIVKEKNTIFDIADEVIEMLDEYNFDARKLRKGIIPDGLLVGLGRIYVDGGIGSGMLDSEIDNFFNYDAKLISNNYFYISAKVLPGEWKKLKKIEKIDNSKRNMYQGNLNGTFRISKREYISKNIIVNSINPNLTIENEGYIGNFVSNEIGLSNFNDEIKQLLIKNY